MKRTAAPSETSIVACGSMMIEPSTALFRERHHLLREIEDGLDDILVSDAAGLGGFVQHRERRHPRRDEGHFLALQIGEALEGAAVDQVLADEDALIIVAGRGVALIGDDAYADLLRDRVVEADGERAAADIDLAGAQGRNLLGAAVEHDHVWLDAGFLEEAAIVGEPKGGVRRGAAEADRDLVGGAHGAGQEEREETDKKRARDRGHGFPNSSAKRLRQRSHLNAACRRESTDARRPQIGKPISSPCATV